MAVPSLEVTALPGRGGGLCKGVREFLSPRHLKLPLSEGRVGGQCADSKVSSYLPYSFLYLDFNSFEGCIKVPWIFHRIGLRHCIRKSRLSQFNFKVLKEMLPVVLFGRGQCGNLHHRRRSLLGGE